MERELTITRTVQRGGSVRRVFRVCVVDVRSGARAGERVRIEQPLFRIGAHASNDLVLPDPTVSQQHLEIRVDDGGYRVIDLDSSNGTWAGGLRLREATVTAPITLELGRALIALTPLDEEVEIGASEAERFGTLVGASPVMRELFWRLEAAARSDAPVLIEGETGVGKERAAESLHLESARAAGPFVVVDCGALAGELLESELFGHVRGAFTGAQRDRVGLLESAQGGTVFFDEIAELPLGLQSKLLGAVERKKVRPVGANASRPVDVRLVAATHRDLGREVNQGRFRADLYYRLAVLRVRVPPLRERLDDLPLLTGELLAELRSRLGDRVPSKLSALALARLQSQPWPGNVRELRSTLERAVAEGTPPPDGIPAFCEARDAFVADFERDYLLGVLDAAGGVVSEAARRAGLERSHFQRLVRRYRGR